ncbi:AF4/FMR2 family member 1 isoform X5 [Falco naumanni]|uniref:AF4/FMR2 family member 1 isoform X5 n=1 Tax=Falco naumanni TaxID=148594 RepID=UPI001ADE3F6D|nr:AF4/FMR2 family member 1 isoform X5 [Falco naumanni]
MDPTKEQSSDDGLYNEDRNLQRIRERERRNQEALQEKDQSPEKTPLFAEPYKTNKGDELSSRIQNMLGNYEEVKDLMSHNKSHQKLIGVPKNVASLIPQQKPHRPYFPEKTSHTLPSSFHRTTHHPPMGPTVVAPPASSHSIHYQKAQSRTDPAPGLHTKSHTLANGQSQGEEQNHGSQGSHVDFHKRNDRHVLGEGHANELQPSFLVLSPLLSSLSSPVAPLSPLHSSQHIDSRSQNSSKSHGPTYSQTKSFQNLVTGSQEKESRGCSAVNLTSTTQPSSQTFPPPLPSKTSAMQQKPTAYVRPMDGQDQAPDESPDLKPFQEEYHREPYEEVSDLKTDAKAKLSKLEIPSEPVEQTFPGEVHSIDEILKPDPPTSNKWQLDNWLTKVNPPAVPTESLGKDTQGDGREEGKEQGQGTSSNSFHQQAELREPHQESSSQEANAPQDTDLPTKHSCQKSPVCSEEPPPRQTVGIKKPGKAPVYKEPKGGLKVESDPGPFEVRDQSSRDKPKVKTKGRPQSCDRRGLKPALEESPENRKHKRSHQSDAKPFLDPKLMRDALFGSTQELLALSPLPQVQDMTPTRTSDHRPAAVAGDDFHKEKLPVLVREPSPVQDSSSHQSLMVKIKLPLLSRVPEKGSHQKKAEANKHPGAKKQNLERKTTDPPDKSIQKRKKEMEKEIDRKKMKLENKKKSLQSSANKDSSKMKASKAAFETQKKDPLHPPLPRTSSAHSAPVSTKKPQKRPRSESNAMDNTDRNKSDHKDPLFSKRQKVESSNGIKESAGNVRNRFAVPSLPNAFKPRRPRLKFDNPQSRQHPVEYYMDEAKRLKHKADKMTSKTARAYQYLDAALSFIAYGIALESDATAPKSAYSIVSDTIELIKFTMTLKFVVEATATSYDKIFAVLCLRCQAILHMALFRYKKEIVLKDCKILNEYFKTSSKLTQAPCSYAARSTGMPSPPPMPSPASSVSSQPGSKVSNHSGNSTGSSVTVPSYVPSTTYSYVNITSCVLYAYNIWEQADELARKNKEFFAELSSVTCTLTLSSHMTELIHYVRQGLHWLRLETTAPSTGASAGH